MSEYTVTGQHSIPLQTEHSIEILGTDTETTHEEADVGIPQQIHIAKQSGKVQGYMWWHRHLHTPTLVLCHPEMLESLGEGRSLISIKKTAEKYGPIASCLLAMHALTGCDRPKNFWYWKSVYIECPAKESTESSGKLGCISWSHC